LELDRHARWLDERIAQLTADGFSRVDVPTSSADGSLSADGAIWVDEVRFLHDPVQGKGSSAGVGSELLRLLQDARESVVVESPYLIPTRSLRRGLAAALDRGVRVRILTNSLATTDNLWAQAGYVGMRQRLATMGVELWEYDGPGSIHTKAGVMDRQTAIVGSFNLDPRSANLNTEVVAVVHSQPVAFEVAEFLDLHLAQAHRIDSRGWPEGSDEPFPGVPRGKILRLRLLLPFAPLIRSQL
jgi:phosphatidylserine/phosphatidylglycerophosphate/cardiolipin synthase-like enzyme